MDNGSNWNHLDKNIKKAWYLSRIIRLIILGIIITTIQLVVFDGFSETNEIYQVLKPYVIGIDVIVALYLVLAIIIYPPIEYRQWRYLISEDRVEIKHGIFFIRTSIIPIVRIQHIDISQGPINRIFKIHSLTIHTASVFFNIPGLSAEVSNEIAVLLRQRLAERLEEEKAVV